MSCGICGNTEPHQHAVIVHVDEHGMVIVADMGSEACASDCEVCAALNGNATPAQAHACGGKGGDACKCGGTCVPKADQPTPPSTCSGGKCSGKGCSKQFITE